MLLPTPAKVATPAPFDPAAIATAAGAVVMLGVAHVVMLNPHSISDTTERKRNHRPNSDTRIMSPSSPVSG